MTQCKKILLQKSSLMNVLCKGHKPSIINAALSYWQRIDYNIMSNKQVMRQFDYVAVLPD